jgi:hypothetical protein
VTDLKLKVPAKLWGARWLVISSDEAGDRNGHILSSSTQAGIKWAAFGSEWESELGGDPSTLKAAGEPLNDVTLEQEVCKEDREDTDDDCRENEVPLRAVLTNKPVDSDGDGLIGRP